MPTRNKPNLYFLFETLVTYAIYIPTAAKKRETTPALDLCALYKKNVNLQHKFDRLSNDK